MLLHWPPAGKIVPLSIGSEIGEIGFRVGGNPPVGVFTPKTGLVYYLTIPLQVDLEASIFVSNDFEVIQSNLETTLGPDSQAVDVVFHTPTPRGNDSSAAYSDTPRGIIYEAEQEDRFAILEPNFGEDAVYGYSKIGGAIHLLRGTFFRKRLAL